MMKKGFRSNSVTCFRQHQRWGIPILLAMLFTVVSVMAEPSINELPGNGTVVGGNVSIGQSGNTMTINQSSDRAAIDWQSYNVGKEATVNYRQPSANSATLNRVTGANPSEIFGRINANGQVFLSNPNGVYFAPGASVDVGGLAATTHDISLEDFMSGIAKFSAGGSTVGVHNAGKLTAALGGYIALLAPEVRNDGIIVARAGSAALVAGEKITLNIINGRQLAGISVESGELAALVDNRSAVLAPDGVVILSAQAAAGLQNAVVRNSGFVEASGIRSEGGRIMLNASGVVDNSGSLSVAAGANGDAGRIEIDAAQVNHSGNIIAASDNAAGGEVVLTAEDIALRGTARIDARGATGGGQVLVGGEWQGGGSTRQATTVSMEQDAAIDASATQNGHGGEIVLWSDISDVASSTRAHGTLLANAGAASGDGGRIETSGYTLDTSAARVRAGAASGDGGLWLLDPADSVIDQTIANGYAGTLNTGTDVINQVAGTMTWNGNVTLTKSGGGDATLTLDAGADLNIGSNARISSSSDNLNLLFKAGNNITLNSGASLETSGGNVTLQSDSDGLNGGHISLLAANINSLGGNVLLSGGVDPTTGFATHVSSGGVTNDSLPTGGVELFSTGGTGSSINAGSGAITLRGRSVGTPDDFAIGVAIYGDAGVTARTTVSGGAINIVGLSENTSSGNTGSMSGVAVVNGDITASGNTSVQGTGSDGVGGSARGNDGITLTNGSVSSTGGDVTLDGTGRGTGRDNPGVGTSQNTEVFASGNVSITGKGSAVSTDIFNDGINLVNTEVYSTNGGKVTLFGTGGDLSTLNSDGIRIEGTTQIGRVGAGVTQAGEIELIGVTGGGSDSEAVAIEDGATVGLGQAGFDQDITLRGDFFFFSSLATTVATTTDTLTIEPFSASFSTAFNYPPDNLTITNTLGGLTLGKLGNSSDINITTAQTVNGDINLFGGNVTFDALTTSGNNAINITASGAVTQTGAIISDMLGLSGSGNFTLTNTTNNVATLASDATGNLSYIDSDTLAIGTVGSLNGINSQGSIDIQTLTGNLGVSQNISTTNATATAVTLNADSNQVAGNAAGGNLSFSGTSGVTVGAGGRATLYSGDISSSTGLTAVVGSGSGRFRYNSDETNTNFTSALGSGVYGIYREQPALTVTASGETTTYGTTPILVFTTNSQNRDTVAQIFSSSPTIAVAGTNSSSGNRIVGTHTLTPSGGVEQLGYNLVGYTAGTLTVNPKILTLDLKGEGNRVYDATNIIMLNGFTPEAGGVIQGDVVSLDTGNVTGFVDKNVGINKPVTFLGFALQGVDSGNYVLGNGTSAVSNATITPAPLSIGGITANSKVYDGTTSVVLNSGNGIVSGVFAGDDFSYNVAGAFVDKNAGSAKPVTLEYAFAGADAGNYAISAQSFATAAITPRSVSVMGIRALDKLADGARGAMLDFSSVFFDGIISGDDLSLASAVGLFEDIMVGDNKRVEIIRPVYGGADLGNYLITDQNLTSASIKPGFTKFDGGSICPGSPFGQCSLTLAFKEEDSRLPFGGAVLVLLVQKPFNARSGIIKVLVPEKRPSFPFELPPELQLVEANGGSVTFISTLPNWLSFDRESMIFDVQNLQAKQLPYRMQVEVNGQTYQLRFEVAKQLASNIN